VIGPLIGLVCALGYLWMFGVNAVTGSLAIRARVGGRPVDFSCVPEPGPVWSGAV